MPQNHPDSRLAPRLLARLAAAQSHVLDARAVAVVLAHPGDETIGCGSLLARLKAATLVLISDGVVRDPVFLHATGFANPAALAEVRAGELRAATAQAGVDADHLVCLDVPEGQVTAGLVRLTRLMATMLIERRIRIVLTHAYEGGHPDHDATAFIVHQANRLLVRTALTPAEIIEIPFTRAGPNGPLLQTFTSGGDMPAVIKLDYAGRGLKNRMVESYATRQNEFSRYGLGLELFRPAPTYDFTTPPNGGRVLYERNGVVTAAGWCAQARAALDELSR